MLRFKAIGAIVLMVVAALVFPVSGANAAGRDDQNNPDQNLLVDQEMTVNGTWTYKVVTITSMGFLTVPKGSTLNAQQIKLKNGSLKVDGGAIVISNITEGKALLSGTATDFTLINGAHITIKAPNGNSNIDFSQGGDAAVDVKASEAVKIAGATIECYAGNGFSNSVPWADHAPVGGYVAAGGNGTVRLGTSLTPVTDVSDLTVTIVGGNGGRAVNGQSWNGNFGGKGGGYSSGGPVSDYVGAGGKGILMVGGTELNIKNIKVSATGGKGGRAGDGGGIAKDSTVYAGSGGGGGYGGGNGGDLNSGGSNQAEDAGPVGDYVGSGGEVAIEFDASNLSVRGIDASAYGGRGGDAGNGGPGNFWGAGGGGGYGGGGGTYSAQWNGYNSNFKGGDGVVSGRVGAGGNITATFVGTNWVQVSNVTLTALAGDGGAAGNAGNAGNGYGGAGGGGGYGGGGGGAYYELGGDGKASGEVGAGGNITVSFIAGTADVMGSGPLGLFSSTFVLFGGSGGKAGAGGNGAGSYNYGSGGGGGYGGGGGGGYGSWNTGKAAGAGTAIDFVGSGGGAFVNFNSNSNPGELVARSNKFYIMGGSGGDGGPAGASGGQYSGGGGGGYAGAGGAYEWAAATATGTCLGSVGNGGDVNFTVFHVAPSISKLNSVSLYGGSGGNGKTQVGAGAHGGPGTGRKTATGVVGSQIPMGVPVLISPADGEIVNAIPPTLEWEHILFSSTDGDVISYSVQVDNHPDFSAPVVDTGVEMDSTFTPTTELALGGVYYWHVQATYLTGNTYGYGPARVFSFNTPPVLKKNIPLYTLWQDNMFNRGFHLINLSNYFTDDLFADQLSYQIIYETDPSHILGTVDGNFLSFTTPTMHWYGQERFAVRASDPLGLWANSNNFTVRVQHVNVPPSILPMPDISVTEGKEHFFDLTPYIIDPDSKLDQMVVSTNSSYIRVDGLGLYLNYTPGVLTQETVSITVNDTMDQSKATLIVNIEPFIAPPVIINPPPWTIVMTEDTEYTMELSGYAVDEKTNATDIVWNVTAVSAGNPPIFNSFILNKHTLKIVPAPNANGAGSLVLVAINQGGKEDSTTLYVTVTPVNDAPVIAKIPDVRILAGATRTIDLARFISDVDNSMSDLKLSSASPMVSVDGLKVTIFVKGDTVESQDMIPIAVSDGLDTTTGEFLVMIAFPPSLPQLIPTIKTTDDKVKEVDLKEYVLDKDTPEAALKWTVSGISDRYFSAYIDPNTHVLKISPKKAGKGEITLTVTDPDGGTASQLVAVQITATKKTTEIQSGVYVVVGFVIIAVVVGIALVIMRRRAGP